MQRLALLALTIAACHHDTPVKAPVATAPAPKNVAPPTPAQKPASPSLAVSDDLAQQCRMQLGNVQAAPKFDFDHADLLPEDRDVLQQIATCVTTGPLAGKKLELVGRTDPRGTEEYNLGLGTRRSGTVAGYLEKLGVHSGQLAETTKGALDAHGSDESTWRSDRRVDIKLEN